MRLIAIILWLGIIYCKPKYEYQKDKLIHEKHQVGKQASSQPTYQAVIGM
jgi:hypothetical protein